MKRPAFLEGVVPSSSAPRRAHEVVPGSLRAVAWAAAPSEHAAPLPMQTLSAPLAGFRPMEAPPPVSAPPAEGFEPLTSASPPPPPPLPSPLPPPAPTVDTQSQARLEAAIATLRLQGERLAEQARSDAFEVGLLVARRILEREISTNLESLFALIKSAIRRVGEAHGTVVRLCPSDVERLRGVADSAFTLGPIELKADDSLEPGDVMVDADHRTVDGRLKARLEEIGRALDEEGA